MGMSVGALADTTIDQNSGDPKTGETELTYTAAESYLITIPESVNLNDESPKESVSASKVVIDENNTLKITVNSEHTWKLQTEGEAQIPYKAKIGESDLSENNEVLSIKGGSGEKEKTIEIDFTINSEDIKASGTYNDTLTFTVDCSATPAA